MSIDAAAHPKTTLCIKDAHLHRVLAGEDLLVLDGAMGSLLQARGLTGNGQAPDLLSIAKPGAIAGVHADYVRAGSEAVCSNTFGANSLKLTGDATVPEVYAAAASCARAAGARYVAGDIGPSGDILEPYGDLEEDEAFRIFAEQARAAKSAGCDLIAIETMTDLAEATCAVRAARATTNLPIFATMSFEENGRTVFGATPEEAAARLAEAGANAVGLNCSLGPESMVDIVRRFADATTLPVIAKPNAGLPRIVQGATIYDVSPDDFADAMERILDAGATIVGGCCGTTPAHIEALKHVVERRRAQQQEEA